MIAFVSTALAIASKAGFEETPLGAWADYQTFLFLSRNNSLRTDLNVVVVEINHLPGGERDPATGEVIPTPRADLLELLRALAASEPTALMLDLDFSPGRKGYLVPTEDAAFLDACLEINATVPLKLGIYRTMLEGESVWLGQTKYWPLAAGLWLPREEPRWVPTAFFANPRARSLPSLGVPPIPSKPVPGGWRALFASKSHVRDVTLAPGYTVPAEFAPIDYSVIRQLQRESISVFRAEDVPKLRGKFKNKIVVIGSTLGGRDAFPVPGSTNTYAGAYIHAATAYTLTNAPIWDLQLWARLTLDILISTCVLLAVAAIEARHTGSSEMRRALRGRVVLLAVAGTLLLGLAMAQFGRLLYTDCVLACLFLALHPRIEDLLRHHMPLHRILRPSPGGNHV